MSEVESKPARRRLGMALMSALLATSMLGSGYAVYLARHQTVYAATAPSLTQNAPLPGALSQQQVPSFAPLAAQVKPAVVNIAATERIKAQMPDMPDVPDDSALSELLKRFRRQQQPDRERTVQALGSGFIVDAAGWVVTNRHVVNGAKMVTVTLDDGRTFEARVHGQDERTDLAVLKIDAKEPLPAVKFGDSDQAQVGDWILAIGNPFGLGGSVTAGIVSARSRDINAGPYDDFLQIDAPINRGNSGGPTFDLSGRVIGVNTAIFSPTGGSVGIGFAIPSKIAAQVTKELIEHGTIKRGWLGVEMQSLTPQLAQAMKRQEKDGALVSQVVPGSPAERAGLKSGDVITSFNGAAVKAPRDLARAVADVKEGNKAPLEVWRDGKVVKATVTIGRMPENKVAANEADPEKQKSAVSTPLGLALAPLTPDVRAQLGTTKQVNGAVVAGVRPDSPASESGLEPGDIIVKVGGKSIETPSDAASAIREQARKDKVVALQVMRAGKNLYVALDTGAG
jgi:serine protease Do